MKDKCFQVPVTASNLVTGKKYEYPINYNNMNTEAHQIQTRLEAIEAEIKRLQQERVLLTLELNLIRTALKRYK